MIRASGKAAVTDPPLEYVCPVRGTKYTMSWLFATDSVMKFFPQERQALRRESRVSRTCSRTPVLPLLLTPYILTRHSNGTPQLFLIRERGSILNELAWPLQSIQNPRWGSITKKEGGHITWASHIDLREYSVQGVETGLT